MGAERASSPPKLDPRRLQLGTQDSTPFAVMVHFVRAHNLCLRMKFGTSSSAGVQSRSSSELRHPIEAVWERRK
jgi:hypothetical protein